MNIKISKGQWNDLAIKSGWLNRIDDAKISAIEASRKIHKKSRKKFVIPKYLKEKYADAITGLDV